MGDSQLDHIRHHQYIQTCASDVGASSLTPERTHRYSVPQMRVHLPWSWVHTSLQLELICYFGCNVLKGNRCPRYSLEADPIERESRQLADFHLPLYEAVLPCISVNTEEQEPLFLFIVTGVGIQHFADLSHHVIGVHWTSGLHAPREPQRSRLGLFTLFLVSLFWLSWWTPRRQRENENKVLLSKETSAIKHEWQFQCACSQPSEGPEIYVTAIL